MNGQSIGHVVDKLGELKAQIATLEEQYDRERSKLIAAGPGAYEGTLFRATVTHGERATLDMKAVRAHLSSQFIRAHTKHTPYDKVNVVARNARDLPRRAA